MNGKLLILISTAVCLFAQTIFAQQYAAVKIKVVDLNGDYISGFAVKLKKDDKIVKEVVGGDAGEVEFSNLKAGKYSVEISAAGFKNLLQEVELRPGNNRFDWTLDIENITESVEIKKDARERSVDEVFSGFYTKEQINALPDTGKEIERELKRRYGADVIIRVDGFSDRVPDKSQIASIRVVQSSYDAENHEVGYTYVNIATRVGEQSFHGTLGFDFGDDFLNARHPFAARRLPQRNESLDFNFLGPLIEKRASFFLSGIRDAKTRRENIVALSPVGAVNDSVDTGYEFSSVRGDVIANLPAQHTARFSSEYRRQTDTGLGVGGFNLPERTYNLDFEDYLFRISESGYIGNRFFNEFRLEFKKQRVEAVSDNDRAAIIVLDAFSAGGAGNDKRDDNSSFWLADNFLFGVKKHAVKFGGLFELEKTKRASAQNRNGTYIFSSLADYDAGKPSLFTQRMGIRRVDVSQTKLGLFVQDDFRIRKSLGLSFGLRYERQNNLDDANNFSPRFGFVWSPLKNGNLTFRGGAGFFYNWLETEALAGIFAGSANQPNEIIIINPVFPDTSATANANPQSRINYWQKAEDLKNPRIVHSSFALNWQLFKAHRLEAEYVFQKGVRQFRARNINAPIGGVRPDAAFGNINQVESAGNFVRNSLRLNANGSVRRGISYGANYTLGKIVSDYDGVFVLPADNYDLKAERAAANNDRRHQFSASINWEIIKGGSLAAIYTLASPLPYTITTGFDDNGDTVFNDRPDGTKRNSARGAWNSQLDVGVSWFFSFVKYGGKKKGTESVVYKPGELAGGGGLTDSNKRFSMKLYATARNILNTTNLQNFVGVQTSPLFGRAVTAGQPREIQAGLRFNF